MLYLVQYRTKLFPPSRPPGAPPLYRTWNLPRNGGGNRKISPQGRRRIPHMNRTVRAVLFSILTLRLSRGRGTLAEFCSFYFLLPFSFLCLLYRTHARLTPSWNRIASSAGKTISARLVNFLVSLGFCVSWVHVYVLRWYSSSNLHLSLYSLFLPLLPQKAQRPWDPTGGPSQVHFLGFWGGGKGDFARATSFPPFLYPILSCGGSGRGVVLSSDELASPQFGRKSGGQKRPVSRASDIFSVFKKNFF